MKRVAKSDAEWRAQLTPDEYAVARAKGTERAFTGRYWDCKDKGTYRCVCCGNELFRSEDKYDSGTGWPSFSAPITAERVRNEQDDAHGMRRVEVLCGACDAHLGHVFDDGPAPSGERYCMNSAALRLEPEE